MRKHSCKYKKGAAGKGDGATPRGVLKWTSPPYRRVLKSDTFQSEGCGGSFAAGIWPLLWKGPACPVLMPCLPSQIEPGSTISCQHAISSFPT